MKQLLLTTLMAAGISLSAMGQINDQKPERILTDYRYTDENDGAYEVRPVGSEYLLHIIDKSKKVEGYCMMDSTAMGQLRMLIGQTTLATEKEYYRNSNASKKATSWRLRVRTTWGPGEDENESVYHYGYLDPADATDPAANQKILDVIQTVHQLLLTTLQTQQETYGYQRLACMEHKVSGFMYVIQGKNGETIFPSEEFRYFNFGDRCVAENHSVREEVTTTRHEFGKEMSEKVGETIQLERYKKPREEYMILDAPRSGYSFYFFDGLHVSFDDNYTKGYEGKWMIPNAYMVERMMEEK